MLLYRRTGEELEVLLVHPGGPYWLRKDAGAWQIPKGVPNPGERGEPLCPARQSGGKIVHAWAIEGDCDACAIRSNEFEMEWPPESGRMERFPEVSAARWLTLEQARTVMLPSQLPLLDRLEELLG